MNERMGNEYILLEEGGVRAALKTCFNLKRGIPRNVLKYDIFVFRCLLLVQMYMCCHFVHVLVASLCVYMYVHVV